MADTVDSGTYTPETIARRIAMAQQLLDQSKQPPVQHWAQGLNELAQGYFGGKMLRGAEQQDLQGQQRGSSAVAQLLLAGGGGGAPSSPGDPTAPRGIRNNNPLNIEAGPFTASLPGVTGSDGRFAQFSTPDAGKAAAAKLLDTYSTKHGLNTVSGIIGRWAPTSDGNDVPAYAGAVAKQIGVSPDQPLNMADPRVKDALVQAMGRYENGRSIGGGGGAAAPTQQGDARAQVAALLASKDPYVQRAVAPIAQSLIQAQLNPKAMKIQNRDGSETVVFVDPTTKKVFDSSGKEVSSDNALGGTANPHGLGPEEYLKSLPSGRRELVQGMLDGRIAPAQLGRYGTKAVQSLLEDAAIVEPGFDMTTFQTRQKSMNDFYGGGKSQETVRKLNQSAAHFGELIDKMGELPGHTVPTVNKVSNLVNTELLGKGAANNFIVNAHALADELSGLFKGAGISDTEIRAWESKLSPNMSEEQQRGMAKTLLGLYRDSMDSLEQKRQSGLGERLAAKHPPVLGPKAISELSRIEKFTGGQDVSRAPAAPAANGAPARIKVSSPEEARKLPKGTLITLPDGSPGVVP